MLPHILAHTFPEDIPVCASVQVWEGLQTGSYCTYVSISCSACQLAFCLFFPFFLQSLAINGGLVVGPGKSGWMGGYWGSHGTKCQGLFCSMSIH